MATTPNMGLVLPTDHATSETWGAVINSALGDTGGGIDGHDHSTGKGVKVPTAGLNINADLSLKPSTTAYALTDVKAVDFNAVASSAVTALAGALFMSDGTGGLSANELYWRTTGGTNVKLTNGAALNVSAFTGGIGGDYTAVAAAENYDNANQRYTFLQGGGTLWARLHSGQVRISETGTSESLFVGLSAPAALASNYTLTLPLVLPGALQLLTVNNSGTMSTSDLSASAVNLAAGLTTTSGGIAAGTNQNVTVSGTGEFKHGDRVLNLPGGSVTPSTSASYAPPSGATVSASGIMYFPIPLHKGDRIKGVTFTAQGNGVTQINPANVMLKPKNANTFTNITTANATGTPPVTQADFTPTITATTLGTGDVVYLLVQVNNSGVFVDNIQVTYDRP